MERMFSESTKTYSLLYLNWRAITRMMLSQRWCYTFSISANTSKKLWFQVLTQNVFIICLSFKPAINANLYFLTGLRNSRRIINIRGVIESMNQNLNLCGSRKESLLGVLVGFHSFTGYDAVSAFNVWGKIKPQMLMMKSKDYIGMLASFRSGIEMDDLLISWLNRFVYHMYSWKGKDSVKNIRYQMNCQSGAKIACEKLPTCEDVLQLHILRANYQAFILQ